MRFSEETLMAYADGELDADTRAAVDAAMANDSDLADAVAIQIENRHALQAKLGATYGSAMNEPVPARLLAAAQAPSETQATATVVDLAAARDAKTPNVRARWSVREWGAIAATLVIGVLVGRFALDRSDDPFINEQGRLVARSELSNALYTQAGGMLDRDSGIQIGVSYLTKNGDYCRTFTLKATNALAGLACHRHNEWALDALTRTTSNASGEYRMAGASVPALILGIVETTIAGDPLDAEQEAEARARGWQR